MSNKVIFKFERRGHLVCDECGYRSEDKVEMTSALIGSKCPKCDAVWFSQEDYNMAEIVYNDMDRINKELGELIGSFPENITPENGATRFTFNTSNRE